MRMNLHLGLASPSHQAVNSLGGGVPWLAGRPRRACDDRLVGVLVHGSAGRDRTGLVSALLLGNAGVAPEAVADDYAASVMAMAGVSSHSPTHDGKPTETRRKPSVGPEIRAPLVEQFVADGPAHLDALGLAPATQERLRALLLG